MSQHRDLSLEGESEVTYTKLQGPQCMNSKGKSTFCIVNSDVRHIS